MLLLLSITGLILSPLLFLAMDRYRLRFGLMWFVALVVEAGFWFYFLQHLRMLPVIVDWPAWGGGFIPGALNEAWFSLDNISWPISFALTSLGLATLLTGLAGTRQFDWRLLGLNLSAQGFGLLGVMAAGIPALAFSWMGYDLMELVVLLRWYRGRRKNRRALRAFSQRTVGTLLLLVPFASRNLDTPDGLPSIGVAAWFLIAASAVRMTSTPFLDALSEDSSEKRGVYNLMRMAPAAGGLALALRFGQQGIFGIWQGPILIVSVISLAYAALGWLTAENALAGRQYWIIGVGMLSIAAVSKGQTEAAVSWVLVLILAGSLLFVGDLGEGAIRWTYPMALVAISGLPYTPAWAGSLAFTGESGILDGVLLFLAALMLLGFYRHGMQSSPQSNSQISGVQALYLFGVLFIFAALIFAGWSPLFVGLPFEGGWWQGAALMVLYGVFWYIGRRGLGLPLAALDKVRYFHSPAWIIRIFQRGFRLSSQVVEVISWALEGDGAVLWALLLLGLVFSAFSGSGF